MPELCTGCEGGRLTLEIYTVNYVLSFVGEEVAYVAHVSLEVNAGFSGFIPHATEI